MSKEKYDVIGKGYAPARVPDIRIERQIRSALGKASSVVNVGAGTGNYEPRLRGTIAVEPSREMIRQRPPGRAPVVCAMAEDLRFSDQAFDVALAIFTIHHWTN